MSKYPQLTAADYALISQFLEQRAGIRLGVAKEYLVSSRLGRLLEKFQLASFSELGKVLSSGTDRRIGAAVIDAMTTNETFWFRDQAHYRALTHDILGSSTQRVRIWSAAVSTGQEAYSIAISLQDAMRERQLASGLRYEILGTDISPRVLEQARSAKYCGVSAARGLTAAQRQRYFRADGDCIEVLPVYRGAVTLREFNLLQSFDGLGRFDVIFCRNVLIYFSPERKRDIVERFARALNPGGYLLLGSTESMSEHADLFEMTAIRGGLMYRRR